MKRYAALCLLAVTVLLGACSHEEPEKPEEIMPPEETETESSTSGTAPEVSFAPELTADTLYERKSDYIGDAAACKELLDALGLEENLGPYRMSLQTETPPYGITLHLAPDMKALGRGEVDAYLSRCGYLFLCLMGNAERFAWEYETPQGKHSCLVNDSFNVKPYRESQERFSELCQVVELLARAERWPADVLISSGRDSYVMKGADAATVSALWAGVKSLKLEKSEDNPDQNDALNVLFYDEKGQLMGAWSFYGEYCRIDGGTQLYKARSDSFSYWNLRWLYDSSRSSDAYDEQGQYKPGA